MSLDAVRIHDEIGRRAEPAVVAGRSVSAPGVRHSVPNPSC